MISVVIPTLNETAELPATLRSIRKVREIGEVIVVDGGSKDVTQSLARQNGCEVLECPPSRGKQLRLGAFMARGDIILLLHADTWLPENAGHAIFKTLENPAVVGGGFYKVFRDGSRLLAGARLKCALRFQLAHRILGDQGIFARRDALEKIGGVPDRVLMEDVELCRLLRTVGLLALAKATVRTSARRFDRLGVLRTYARMGRVFLQYRFGATDERLKEIYERE